MCIKYEVMHHMKELVEDLEAKGHTSTCIFKWYFVNGIKRDREASVSVCFCNLGGCVALITS